MSCKRSQTWWKWTGQRVLQGNGKQTWVCSPNVVEQVPDGTENMRILMKKWLGMNGVYSLKEKTMNLHVSSSTTLVSKRQNSHIVECDWKVNACQISWSHPLHPLRFHQLYLWKAQPPKKNIIPKHLLKSLQYHFIRLSSSSKIFHGNCFYHKLIRDFSNHSELNHIRTKSTVTFKNCRLKGGRE